MAIILSHDANNIYINSNGDITTISKPTVISITSSGGYVYIQHVDYTFFKYSFVTAPTTSSIGDLVSLLWSWVYMYTVIPSTNNYMPAGW